MEKAIKKTVKRDIYGKEREQLRDEVRRAIGKSKTDVEICEDLNIRKDVLRELKKELLAIDGAVYNNLSSVAVFQDFVEKSRDNIREIDGFFRKFKNRGQWSSLVAGIKVKQEIHKDVIKLGQDLGFIDKKTGELKVSGEIGFSTLAEHEVLAEIKKEMDGISKMLRRKPVDTRAEVLDVVGEEVHKFLPAPSNGKKVIIPEVVSAEKKKPKKVLTKFKVHLKKRV